MYYDFRHPRLQSNSQTLHGTGIDAEKRPGVVP